MAFLEGSFEVIKVDLRHLNVDLAFSRIDLAATTGSFEIVES